LGFGFKREEFTLPNDKQIIDLRSDTVTKPTPRMRHAMAEAEVGDDVYGEDPTIRRLEETAAEMLKMEAAIYLPTGTMGNQVALHVHCRPGSEVVVEAKSHIMNYEMAAMAALSGLLPNPVYTEDGIMAFRPDIYYLARTGLVALENTHNMAGGRVMPLDRIREIQTVTRRARIALHLDGARIFNAAATLGVPVNEAAFGFDSVMFCLSKGLGAPVGSLLCASKEFIVEARRVRKMFGGGMRQAGVIAAAGLVALEDHVDRISEDHDTARKLADGLAGISGIEVPVYPESNILMCSITDSYYKIGLPEGTNAAAAFVDQLREKGVLALAINSRQVRMVTHFDLPEDAVGRTIDAAASGR
jgi:threonine aldolase